MNEIKVFSDINELFGSLADDFVRRANSAIKINHEFTVVLSGGDTPKLLFDRLSHHRHIPWGKIKFFFGDERYVSSNSINSNYHMAYEHLFSKVPIVTQNIYPIPTELADPKAAAKDYELTLHRVFRLQPDQFPKFDLLYLGLGEDGHTASLMPFINVPDDQLVASLWVPEQSMYRITLTPSAINHAKNITFIVMGEDKALAVQQVLEGQSDPQRYPAQLIKNATWYLDQAAASKLERSQLQ